MESVDAKEKLGRFVEEITTEKQEAIQQEEELEEIMTNYMTDSKPTPQATVAKEDGKGNLIDWLHQARADVEIIDKEQGIVAVSPPRKSVAIVGYAASTRGLAPFDDPSFEIWGLNQLNRFITRADRWFEMHDVWNEHVVDETNHEEFIKGLPIPVYMPKVDPNVPNSVRFPKDALVKEFGIEYFTSTIAEMLALAIYEGFTRINLYGIDLIVGEEYTHQKPCAEFWLGIAHAKNIIVTIPETSALLTSRFSYGYQIQDIIPLPNQRLRERLNKAKAQKEDMAIRIHTLDGAIQVLESIIYAQELWERGGDTSIF
jgi:hypothetical protein